MLKKLLLLLGVTVFLTVVVAVSGGSKVSAAVLKNAYVSLNNPVTAASGVTHTFKFITSASSIGSIKFIYCVNPSGTCTDSGAVLASAATSTVTDPSAADDTANWTSTGVNGTFTVTGVRSSVMAGGADGTWTYAFSGMTNPAYANCTYTSSTSTGTCYIRVTTFTDTASASQADDAVISITVTQAVTITARIDPSFTMVVTGVNGATTNTANGTPLTSTISTTSATSIPFGNLQVGTPKFAAQRITVTTNAPLGYTVTARMTNNMIGSAYISTISPFIGGGATVNTTSASWTSPTGTINGSNTGWLGVGTDDTGVTGRGSNQFFPLGTSAQTVVNSSTSAQSDNIYVVYGMEVNAYQQADSYSGTMRYNAVATY